MLFYYRGNFNEWLLTRTSGNLHKSKFTEARESHAGTFRRLCTVWETFIAIVNDDYKYAAKCDQASLFDLQIALIQSYNLRSVAIRREKCDHYVTANLSDE